MDWFRRSVGSFQNAWSGFPVSYRVLTGFLLVLLALVAVWGVNAAGKDGWVRIADAGQPLDKRGKIVERLRELNIKTKVDGEGVFVLAHQADEAMLQLHTSGALGDDAIFKFLRETRIFETRENSDRQWLVAVQGRLAALIQNLPYVRRAWVQISEPGDVKRPFWANGPEATAAVILELKPSEKITARRAAGIAALVAAARTDIKPSGVKILDETGQLIRVPESEAFVGQGIREQELEIASSLEAKALVVLPPNSRVAVTVRLNAESRKVEQKTEERNVAVPPGVTETNDDPPDASKHEKTEHRNLLMGASIEFVSVAALIPNTANDVPRDATLLAGFLRDVRSGLRMATGAQEKDISIRIAALSESVLKDAVPATVAPPPATGYRIEGATAGLILLGLVALLGAYRLVRGLAPAAESGVVAEESLRVPGESILSAQDEALDRIRDGVRQSVTRNPREAADVARRWLSP
jgi:flagellar biosynthesis/type III secretory pathway M-ring protein FliF/YscJ